MPSILRKSRANVFLRKSEFGARELPAAVSDGIAPDFADRAADVRRREWQSRINSLGDSERFVLQMILIGMRDREISLQQGVSAGAIAARRRRLIKKLGVHNVVGSPHFALRVGG